MLLVPLLALSEFKWQLKYLQLCHSDRVFYERVLERQSSSRTGVPPSALGSVSSWSVFMKALTVLCSLVQVFYFLCVCVCACVCVYVDVHVCVGGGDTFPTLGWLWP